MVDLRETVDRFGAESKLAEGTMLARREAGIRTTTGRWSLTRSARFDP